MTVVWWPRCPTCGAFVDCVSRKLDEDAGVVVYRFRCKLESPPMLPSPDNGHVFTMTEAELEKAQQ